MVAQRTAEDAGVSLQILIAIDLGRNGFPQGSQQSLSLIGDAAGERHYLGKEAVDDIGDTYGEVVDVPLHHGDGGRVPLLLGTENGLAVDITNLCGGGAGGKIPRVYTGDPPPKGAAPPQEAARDGSAGA